MTRRNPNISIHSHSLAMIAEPERIRAARRGEIMHAALGALGARSSLREPEAPGTARKIDAARLERAVAAAFAALGVDPKGWKLTDEFLNPLSKAFTLPQFARWFGENTRSFEEAEIVDAGGEVYRPDRVVMRDDRIEVIDFKVGRREQGHVDQVRGYMSLLQAIFDKTRVAGYIVYLDEPAVVEVT